MSNFVTRTGVFINQGKSDQSKKGYANGQHFKNKCWLGYLFYIQYGSKDHAWCRCIWGQAQAVAASGPSPQRNHLGFSCT